MRQHRTNALVPPHTHTPGHDGIRETQTSMSTHRAAKLPAVVLGLALGTALAVILLMLSAWLSPSTPATVRVAASAEPSRGQPLSPGELEDAGIASLLLEDVFARF
jgi:hypothetical protein